MLAVLVIARSYRGLGETPATVVLDVAVTSFGWGLAALAGGVPVAVAVFVIDPALTSAAVVVYVAVQVSLPPGAKLAPGQKIADRPTIGSMTVTGSSVTFPVFITAKLYVTEVPAEVKLETLAALTSVMLGADGALTEAIDADEVTAGPLAGVPVAVAESLITPLSMSDWVAA